MTDGDDRTPQERVDADVRASGPPGGPGGPPAGAGAHGLDVAPPTCEACGRPMVRGTGDGKDLGPRGPVWLCNGGPGDERHPWVWREREVVSGAALQSGCDHSNTVFPTRPEPDAWYVCPDCGQRVGRRGGEIITVEENNRRAAAAARAKQVQVDSVFQARERMRAMLTRRGVRLHDDVLDELAQITSPPGVQWDQAERERATRRVLSAVQRFVREDAPIGAVLVACFTAVNAVLDFPGVDPLHSPGLESRSTDPPAVQDESLLDRAQVDIELGELKILAGERGLSRAFDWIVHHQNEADRVLVDYDPPPLDPDLARCARCIAQAEQRGVPYEEVFRANHDHSGAHVGPSTAPAEAVDIHVHEFEPTGSMDTGHSPPRRQWRCVCGETEWTDDPRGPEVTA